MYLSIYLPTYLSIYLPIYLPIYLSIDNHQPSDMKNERGSRTSRPGRKIVYAWWRIWPRSRPGPVDPFGFLAKKWGIHGDWPPMFGPKTDQPSVDEARKHCGDTILDPRGSSRWGVTVLAKSQSSWQNILAIVSPMFVGYFIFPNVLSLVSFVWHCSQPTISLDPWFLVCEHI